MKFDKNLPWSTRAKIVVALLDEELRTLKAAVKTKDLSERLTLRLSGGLADPGTSIEIGGVLSALGDKIPERFTTGETFKRFGKTMARYAYRPRVGEAPVIDLAGSVRAAPSDMANLAKYLPTETSDAPEYGSEADFAESVVFHRGILNAADFEQWHAKELRDRAAKLSQLD